MNGHVTKRGSKWAVRLDLGAQPAQRCPACTARKGRNRGRLLWSDAGRYEACPTCGGELEDVRARRQVLLPERYRTKKEATARLVTELQAAQGGGFVEPSEMTVGAYLTDEWLPSLAGEGLASGTVRLYETHIRQRVLPVLNNVPLQKLSTRHVKQLATYMATHKGARGRVPSAQTRKQTLIVLHKALAAAQRDGLVRMNAAQGVKRPRVRRREMQTWTAGELHTFLEATKDSRLAPLWRFLSHSGLRRGEVLGLHVEDLDLDASKVIIRRQRKQDGYRAVEGPLKSDAARSVSIDAATVAALRAQLDQQLEDAAEWGEAWHATGHVFTRADGQPWHPDRVSKLFDQAVKATPVPPLTLHGLRHTWASLALRAGVHPKVVQERLGHASIGITLDLYSHVMPDLQAAAAEVVAALVEGGGQ